MYRSLYVEVSDDGAAVSRAREQAAFDHVLAGLEAARTEDGFGPVTCRALRDAQELWGFLIRDLMDEGNGLPGTLKDDLIAVGLSVIQLAAAGLDGRIDAVPALLDIIRPIRDGLG